MKAELKAELAAWLQNAEYGYGDDRKLIRKLIAALEEADAVAEAVAAATECVLLLTHTWARCSVLSAVAALRERAEKGG